MANRISQKWYGILDRNKHSVTKTGKVVIYFKLHSDGTVSDMKIKENNVTDFQADVCVRAIQTSAPFPEWPPEMVKKLGTHKDVVFTFDYYDK